MTYTLRFGSLDFTPGELGSPSGATYEVYSLKRGRPVPVVSVVNSLLLDGSLERVDGYENRDQSLLIGVKADDSLLLGEAETALHLEVQKPLNTLSFSPPDGYGATTVFDVLWADLQPYEEDDWDLLEVQQGLRYYTLAFRCAPFGRSVDRLSTTATPTVTAPTVLSAATSTAGWSAPVPAGSTVAVGSHGGSGCLVVSGTVSANQEVHWSGTYPTQDYVGLVLFGDREVYQRTTNGGTNDLPLAVEPYASKPGYYIYWFANPRLSSPLRFVMDNPTGQVYIGALLQAVGFGSSSLLEIRVQGSVRAPADIVVSRPDRTFQWVTVFTDPAMSGGAYHPAVLESWANAPAGTYSLWTEIRTPATGGSVTVTAVDSLGNIQSAITDGNSYGHPAFMPVGEFTFGGRRDGKVGPISLQVEVDGVIVAGPTSPRLFRKAPETTLTAVVRTPGGAAVSSVSIESPSLDQPYGGVWMDDQAVGSRFVSYQLPIVAPPMTSVFVEADESNSYAVTTTVNYHPRWHTNAGPLEVA